MNPTYERLVMNSKSTEAGPSPRIVLKIKGLGPCPSFKNRKRICGKRLVTRRDVKQWMNAVILSLRSELRFLSQTTAKETRTECCPRCLTALLEHSKKFDDSWQWLPALSVDVIRCDTGKEGAKIEIELIPK